MMPFNHFHVDDVANTVHCTVYSTCTTSHKPVRKASLSQQLTAMLTFYFINYLLGFFILIVNILVPAFLVLFL